MLRKYIKNEDGNFAVAAAIAMLPLMLAVGVAIDVGLAQSKKAKLQNALDIATMASTINPNANEGALDGELMFRQQVSDLRLGNYSMDISVDNGTHTGTVEANLPLTFGGILKQDTINLAARTVVTRSVETGPAPCIMALSETRERAITFNSGAHINSPDCIIQVSSTRNPAASINSGITLDVEKICIAGSGVTNNKGHIPQLELNCPVIEDPFEDLYPEPDNNCSSDNLINNQFRNEIQNAAVVNLSPGLYCGHLNLNNNNATVNFAPGTYVIKDGSWNIAGGTWNGDGVTFYFIGQNARLQFNSGVTANMTPPATGNYAGVFMAETKTSSNNQSHFTLNVPNGFDFEGLIYLPTRNLTFNSGSQVRSLTMALVADTITFNDANINLSTISIGGGGSNGGGGSVTTPAYISE